MRYYLIYVFIIFVWRTRGDPIALESIFGNQGFQIGSWNPYIIDIKGKMFPTVVDGLVQRHVGVHVLFEVPNYPNTNAFHTLPLLNIETSVKRYGKSEY
jgi:hypothetical protein